MANDRGAGDDERDQEREDVEEFAGQGVGFRTGQGAALMDEGRRTGNMRLRRASRRC